MHCVILHEVLFECLYVGVYCGCGHVEGLVRQGAWTAERHVMAGGTHGPIRQLIFDNSEYISMYMYKW